MLVTLISRIYESDRGWVSDVGCTDDTWVVVLND